MTATMARMARVGAKVDAVSYSVKVVAKVRDDYPELIAGMTGRVQMPAP
jgi:membrane fusion protein (multidrug efflux system)